MGSLVSIVLVTDLDDPGPSVWVYARLDPGPVLSQWTWLSIPYGVADPSCSLTDGSNLRRPASHIHYTD